LVSHRLAGLTPGATVSVTRAALPGAVLFRALHVPPPSSSTSSSSSSPPALIDAEAEGEAEAEEEGRASTGASDYLRLIAAEAGTEQPADPAPTPAPAPALEPSPAPSPVPLPVYLILTRERVLVLDGTPPLGSEAAVLANHHLTAVTKVVYRKRDPLTVTLSLLGGGTLLPAPGSGSVPEAETEAEEGLAFRLERRDVFIALLQRSMMRFK